MKPLVVLLLLASVASANYVKRENGHWVWEYQCYVPDEWGGTRKWTRYEAATDSIDEFRAMYPAVFADTFRDQLEGDFPEELAPAPNHVWQLFTDIRTPDTATFHGILTRLGDVDYQVRKSAWVELNDPRWSRLAWSLDLSNQSPEVRTRIGTYRRRYGQLEEWEVAALRNDPDYLRDCMKRADPILLVVIQERLNELNG